MDFYTLWLTLLFGILIGAAVVGLILAIVITARDRAVRERFAREWAWGDHARADRESVSRLNNRIITTRKS